MRLIWDNTHVVLPGDLAEGDGVDVLVEDDGEGDGEVEDVETLGTKRVGQDLNGVGDNERSEGNTVCYISTNAYKKMRMRLTRKRRRRGR